MNITFDPDGHIYRIDGEIAPSVTHITRFLMYDTAQTAQPWRRDAAAKRGTDIHALTVLLDYGEDIPDDTPQEYIGYLSAYKNFLRDARPDWTGIEHITASHVPRYCGTVDRYGYLFGHKAVLDIKTGAEHKQAISAQLTGYSVALRDRERFDAEKLYGLYLHADGTATLRKVKEDKPLFMACCTINERIGKNK